jgi:uncharacterized protein YxjI
MQSELEILKKKLTKIEAELEKVRGKEYDLTFGSQRRAKVSRKWDCLAQEKFEIEIKIEELQNENKN